MRVTIFAFSLPPPPPFPDATAFRLGTDGDDFGDGLAEDRCGRVVAAGSTTGVAVDGDDSEGGLDFVVYIFGGAFPTNPGRRLPFV